jgi:quercetin dioxygenase-like cupin family protein
MKEGDKELAMKRIFVGTALGVGLALTALVAQNPGLKRTIVHKADVSVPGREAVIAAVEIAPGGSTGRHTHPGEEITYLIEGEGELLVDGEPARKLKAGDGFIVPPGKKHDARNTGAQTMKLAVVYLVDKDKPMATPAP